MIACSLSRILRQPRLARSTVPGRVPRRWHQRLGTVPPRRAARDRPRSRGPWQHHVGHDRRIVALVASQNPSQAVHGDIDCMALLLLLLLLLCPRLRSLAIRASSSTTRTRMLAAYASRG